MPQHNKGKRAGIRERTALKRAKALELRLSGMPYVDIAKAVGVSESRAHQMVKEYLDKLDVEMKENGHRVRQMELRRLDRLLNRAMQRLDEEYTDKTIEVILKIQERRTRYLGLDKPGKKEVLFSTAKISDFELKKRAKTILLNENSELAVRTDSSNQETEH